MVPFIPRPLHALGIIVPKCPELVEKGVEMEEESHALRCCT